MTQSISVRASRNLISMNPSNRTTLNVWMGVGPYRSLAIESAPRIIGEIAVALLDQSCVGVPHPPDLHRRPMSEDYFAALGLEPGKVPKSLRSCSILRQSGILTFSPMRHKGGGSFVAIGDARFTLDTDEPQAVGQAVLRCLDACR